MKDISYTILGGRRVVLKDGTIDGLVSYLPLEQAIEHYEQSRHDEGT